MILDTTLLGKFYDRASSQSVKIANVRALTQTGGCMQSREILSLCLFSV